MSAKLKIKLDKYFEGFNLDDSEGVLCNIYAVRKPDKTQASASKGLHGVTIPVTSEEEYAEFDLDPGLYVVECILPSGQMIQEDVELKEGDELKLVLEDEKSPREYLAWQQMSGNIARQSVYTSARSEPKKRITKSFRGGYERKRGEDTFKLKSLGEDLMGSQSSPIWQEMLELRGDVENTLDELDTVVLAGLVDVSEGEMDQLLAPDRIWTSLRNMSKSKKSDELQGFLEFSRRASGIGMRGPSKHWIRPWDEESEVNYFRLDPRHDVDINRLLIWTPSGAELIFCPPYWQDVKRHQPAIVEIMLDVSDNDVEFRANTSVSGTYMATALAYMQSGSLPKAKHYLKQAAEVLFEKMDNPYAAAAGGYILLETLNWDLLDEANSEYHHNYGNWRQWIENLKNWKPWLPDGAVLHGWSLVYSDNYEDAKAVFKEAYNRGVPIYAAIFAKLLEGLKLFEHEDDEIKEMVKTLRGISWRTNMQQLFTTIRLGPSLKS